MKLKPDWLPELVLFENYDGNWEKYLSAIYEFFCEDFVKSKPSYRGIKLSLKRHPMIDGKEATFWHIITSGKSEDERIPDLRRCERIKWPKPIIENDKDPVLKVWQNKRKTDTRIILWFEDEDYLVVLNERKGYILLWTAYLITQNHQKRKLKKEYEAYIKSKSRS